MARKLDLTSLELFVAVCESRSIAHAAELRNITASAISKRISQLEEFAGTPLLTRTNSGVAPTSEGARLLEHARNVLYNLELIERDVGSAENLRGCVRIFANRSANAEFVPSLVTPFLTDPTYREIDVQVNEMTSHEVVAGVKDGLAMLGVCWAETDMAGVEWRPSKRETLSAVVAADHPLAHKERIAFTETLDYDQVGITSGGPVTNQLRRESLRAGKLLRYRVVAPTFDAMVRVVASGLALAIMPSEVALRYARSARIAVVPLTDAWRERQFAVCCRSRRALSRPAAALFDQLAAASTKS
jgi:DNA-binding transcriptional LysR family regulator